MQATKQHTSPQITARASLFLILLSAFALLSLHALSWQVRAAEILSPTPSPSPTSASTSAPSPSPSPTTTPTPNPTPSPTNLTPQISISEFYPAPLPGESEWVELYNAGTNQAVLSGWTLEDQLSTPSTIFSFTNQVIEPNSYLVIVLSSAKLNNATDGITLKNPQTATVHSISYEGSSPGSSWSVAAGGELYLTAPTPGSVNAPQPMPSPTPEISPPPNASASPVPTPSPNPTATPTTTTPLTAEAERPLPTDISLTEINACPLSGQPEWIELYNAGKDPLIISSWKITDEAGNTRTISGTLPANSYQTFSWSGSLLNNTGDSLTLTTALGNTIATAEYQDCQVGTTLYLHGDIWTFGTPTPGSAPLLTQNTQDALSSATTAIGDVLGAHTAQATNPDAQTKTQEALLSSLYKNQPLPIFLATPASVAAPESSAGTASSTGDLIKSTLPQARVRFSQSVILGSLFFLTAGGYLWYAESKTSPLNLVERLFTSNPLGQPHFLSQLTERIARI
jgi:hypothetical protein